MLIKTLAASLISIAEMKKSTNQFSVSDMDILSLVNTMYDKGINKITFLIMQLTSLNIFINRIGSSPIYIFPQTTHGKFPVPII